MGSGGSPIQKRGRRTGTGSEVWYTRDEGARECEVLHPQGGVLYKSGVYARNDLCLTLGRFPGRPQGLGSGRLVPTGREKSAEGKVAPRQAELWRHTEAERWGNG
jgi:hypothetical protein